MNKDLPAVEVQRDHHYTQHADHRQGQFLVRTVTLTLDAWEEMSEALGDKGDAMNMLLVLGTMPQMNAELHLINREGVDYYCLTEPIFSLN